MESIEPNSTNNRGLTTKTSSPTISVLIHQIAMKATDRHNLINRIKSLEGLTDDERAALLGLLRESKTYGLVWEDKPEAVEERLRTELPVLKEVKSRAIISDNADAPNHILIEGDNLEALTALAYTHEGKIDVIYIDPPYNTGNKDFVYNDSYVDSEDSYRHSKWLSFMSRRLRIAKRLLSDRGVIFISIDDNELHNLLCLCDSYFGEDNRISIITWQKIHSIKNDAKYFSDNHEYLLCYAKHAENIIINLLPRTEDMNSRYKNPDNDPRGPWQSGDLVANGERTTGHFIVTSPTTGKEFDVPQGKHWVYSQENLEKLIASNSVWFGKDGNSFPRKKRFLCEVQDGRTPNNLWLSDEVGHNQTAVRELKDILNGNLPFDYPKPSSYIKRMLQVSGEKNSVVLDFFAGSGTTLHAVMQLNAEDRGKRQCILCTNNENGICENVTYERNKRVIQGYTKPNGDAVEGLHDNNLRYYRTDYVGRRRIPHNMRRLMLLASDMLCIKENLYTEHDNFDTLPTLENGFRYFSDGKKQMLIVYNEEVIYPIMDALEDMDVVQPVIIYVFSPGNDAWDSEFERVADKVRLTALPAAIYNAYKRVLPKAKDTLLDPPPVGAQNFAPTDAAQSTNSLFDFDDVDEKGGLQ